ncbi:MAG: hypothetical protein AMXMBFR34_46640 [Myxococcaceae bacterium]
MLTAETWFDDVPRCAAHGAGPATACERCGRFCCPLCADTEEPGLCETCAVAASRTKLPKMARGVAWKLALAPAFVLVSAGVLAARHELPPPSLAVWAVPIACAVILLVRPASLAAWFGTVTSLAILGWQALGTASNAQWDRLIDVGVLSIAPLAAIAGTVRLSRLRARVQLANAAASLPV